jgi:hypothetical protein
MPAAPGDLPKLRIPGANDPPPIGQVCNQTHSSRSGGMRVKALRENKIVEMQKSS